MSDDLKKPEEMDMYDEEIMNELEELDNETIGIDEFDFDALDFDEEETDYERDLGELGISEDDIDIDELILDDIDLEDCCGDCCGGCGCHSEPEDDFGFEFDELDEETLEGFGENGTTDEE